MSLAAGMAAIAPMGAFCIGTGLFRRGRRAFGAALVAAAVAAVVTLAITGAWRPLLSLIAVAALIGGLEVDRPGDPRRRALGLLGIAVGLFSLIIAGLYT